MTSTPIAIAPADVILQETKPQIMPFHITHNGPAPIRTFFKVKAATLETPLPTNGPGNGTDVSIDASDKDGKTESGVGNGETRSTDLNVGTSGTASTRTSQNRFVAAFRGRTVQGLEKELPEGYGGVILKADGIARTQTRSTEEMKASSVLVSTSQGGKSTTRQTRRSTRSSKRMEIDEENEDDGYSAEVLGDPMAPGTVGGSDEQITRRMLKPTARFSSLVVWNPDIPVDENRDEYLRALVEWTKIAADVRVLCFISLSLYPFPPFNLLLFGSFLLFVFLCSLRYMYFLNYCFPTGFKSHTHRRPIG